MKIENFIPLKTLVTHYKVELSFFSNLSGLVEIQTVEQVQYIHQDSIYEIEK
jgi:predicted xylose isomerase-like sugar epimerase